MRFNELEGHLVDWWKSGEDHITLLESNDLINLQRNANGLLLSVQLTHTPSDNLSLETWMRYGQLSLEYFQGALAQAPASGHLWLLQQRPGDCGQDQLLDSLQALLNQRDTWRSMWMRPPRPMAKKTPLLRSLPH